MWQRNALLLATIDLQWFAAEDEGRTEEPSEYKLERARQEGRLAKSPELSSAFVLLLTVAVLIVMGPAVLRTCAGVFRFYFTRCASPQLNDPNLATAFFSFFLRMVLPVSITGAIGGIVGNLIQNRGFIFSWKPITPQFSKIVPRFGEYFRKTLFSFQGVFNIVKSIGKLVIIAVISFLLISRDVPVLLMAIQNGDVGGAIARVAQMSAGLLAAAAIVFLIIAIPDYFVQRREFRESMKMTKQEVREEYKELEGDPHVKGRLMQAQMQLLQQNMPRAVQEADVVITNPTHYAVALKYDRAVADAPQVTAKGADQVALAMRRIAAEHNVPVVENRPIARGLYTDTRIGDIIPETYLKAIAVIYAHIMQQEDRDL
ncbi:MAG: EscU/YscU/HrcU family type III secretion system export apparatus switch protein [Treponema sp.]|nr:EscU/YscU/HrcU family type III secretion system export apparatus switch protein [Treponema sp.]